MVAAKLDGLQDKKLPQGRGANDWRILFKSGLAMRRDGVDPPDGAHRGDGAHAGAACGVYYGDSLFEMRVIG
jgi:hypothetical protein